MKKDKLSKNKQRALKNIQKISSMIVPVLKRHSVCKAGLFGSYARGEQKKLSDVDILVSFRGRKSLLDLAGVELELEKVLQKRVDLLTYKSLNPLLKYNVLKEEVRII
jgi:hypothetical protein